MNPSNISTFRLADKSLFQDNTAVVFMVGLAMFTILVGGVIALVMYWRDARRRERGEFRVRAP